jgi:hypothetical protein
VLQPNHGGYSSLRRLQPLALSQALISELGVREGGRGASIGAGPTWQTQATAMTCRSATMTPRSGAWIAPSTTTAVPGHVESIVIAGLDLA